MYPGCGGGLTKFVVDGTVVVEGEGDSVLCVFVHLSLAA